jgi:2-methylcitrate dehydratase PrpD
MAETSRKTTGETMKLAEFFSALTYEQLPVSSKRAVRHFVLDTLGCALYGRDTEWAGIVRKWAMENGAGIDQATVWGEEAPALRASDAALVNGTAAHAFELDDYHPVKHHPGAVVIPAALALGEKLGSSGEDLITAIAAGYELMIRTSYAMDPTPTMLRGWHITGICGAFGAAAAAAKLLHLDTEQTAWAYGIAGTEASGLFAWLFDGAMTKRFHAGDAARAGIVAAELAALGYTGSKAVFEFENGGFLKAYSDHAVAAKLVENLGSTWMLEGTSFKPYACCGSTHAYVDAAKNLRERYGDLVSEPDGRKVRVGLPHLLTVQCGYDYEPGTTLNGQMSVRYCVASAFRYGGALPDEFADDKLADDKNVAFSQAIELVHDEKLDSIYPANFCGWVEVETKPGSGDFDREFLLNASGSCHNPDKDRAMRDKFHMLLGDILDADGRNAIENAVMEMEKSDARALVKTMTLPLRAAAE